MLEKIMEMIFYQMIDISSELTKEWESPPEGFDDSIDIDSDLEEVRFGMETLNRLISAMGQKQILPLLSKLAQKMFLQDDWRYKHAAIMALSQVGEYLEKIEEVGPIIDKVLSFGLNENPKLRYAVCHCIGQISDDMAPKFQSLYHESVVATLLNLMNDKTPRVVSHSAAALANFVEGVQNQHVQLYLKTILQTCFQLLNNSISFVKENCISVISSLAQVLFFFFLGF